MVDAPGSRTFHGREFRFGHDGLCNGCGIDGLGLFDSPDQLLCSHVGHARIGVRRIAVGGRVLIHEFFSGLDHFRVRKAFQVPVPAHERIHAFQGFSRHAASENIGHPVKPDFGLLVQTQFVGLFEHRDGAGSPLCHHADVRFGLCNLLDVGGIIGGLYRGFVVLHFHAVFVKGIFGALELIATERVGRGQEKYLFKLQLGGDVGGAGVADGVRRAVNAEGGGRKFPLFKHVHGRHTGGYVGHGQSSHLSIQGLGDACESGAYHCVHLVFIAQFLETPNRHVPFGFVIFHNGNHRDLLAFEINASGIIDFLDGHLGALHLHRPDGRGRAR